MNRQPTIILAWLLLSGSIILLGTSLLRLSRLEAKLEGVKPPTPIVPAAQPHRKREERKVLTAPSFSTEANSYNSHDQRSEPDRRENMTPGEKEIEDLVRRELRSLRNRESARNHRGVAIGLFRGSLMVLESTLRKELKVSPERLSAVLGIIRARKAELERSILEFKMAAADSRPEWIRAASYIQESLLTQIRGILSTKEVSLLQQKGRWPLIKLMKDGSLQALGRFSLIEDFNVH